MARTIKGLMLDEISICRKPANAEAVAAIAKGDRTEKAVMITTLVDGHQHTLVGSGAEEYNYGTTSYEVKEGEEYGHSHSWIRMENGSVALAAAQGHNHTIEAVGKEQDEESTMATPNTNDPVLYKSVDGTEYRASGGTAAADLAKKLDAVSDQLSKEQAGREDAELAKQAADLEHLTGTADVHKAICKALNGIEDEGVRKAAFDVVKNANDITGLTKQVGANSKKGRIAKQVLSGDAQSKLDKMAEDAVKADPKLTKAAAMAQVLKTADGAKLYAETR